MSKGGRPGECVGRRNVGRVKQLADVGRWHRPAKQIPLSFVNTIIAEEQFELLLGLDALNHNVEPQLRAEPRHPAQQGHSALVIDKSPKERLVDLDLVKRKAVQVAEARVGGTKVVQGDFHSQALQ